MGIPLYETVSSLLEIIAGLYSKFLFQNKSINIDDAYKTRLQNIYDFWNLEYDNLNHNEKLVKAVECEVFIPTLAEMLFKEYERKVIVMIDEYDVPLHKAVVAEDPYYNKMLEIIRKITAKFIGKRYKKVYGIGIGFCQKVLQAPLLGQSCWGYTTLIYVPFQ